MQLGELLERIADGPIPELDYGRVARHGIRRRLVARAVRGAALLVVAALLVSTLPRDARPAIDPVMPLETASPSADPAVVEDRDLPPVRSPSPPARDRSGEAPTSGSSDAHQIVVPTAGQTAPDAAVQPHGSWVWTSEGSLGSGSSVHVGAVGGDERVLAADGRGARFSPDGRRVAFVDNQGLNVVAVDGTGLRRLDDLGLDAVLGVTLTGVTWSPDGTRIAYHAPTCSEPCTTGGRSGIWIVDALSEQPQPVRLDPSGQDPSWSPTSDEVAFWDGFDLVAMRVDGSDRRVIWDQPGTPNFVPRWPAWSPDGRHVAVVVGPEGYSPDARMTTGVRVVDVATGATVAAAEGPDGFMFREGGPAWSPDGTRLAWSAFTDDSGANAAVFVADALLGGMRIVGLGGTPRWSPDGGWVVTATTLDGGGTPWLRAFEVDGERIIATAYRGWEPDWAP